MTPHGASRAHAERPGSSGGQIDLGYRGDCAGGAVGAPGTRMPALERGLGLPLNLAAMEVHVQAVMPLKVFPSFP